MLSQGTQIDYRNLIIGANTQVPLINGKYVTAVNFDNAATTPPFVNVLKDLADYSPWYSSIHRGKGYKSILSSDIYEKSRDMVKSFVNADRERDVVIFTKNTTESINMLSYLLEKENRSRNVIISTLMEHSANDLPWREKYLVEYAEVDKWGRLYLQDLEDKLKKNRDRVKLVAVTGASNVTGYINPVHKIAGLAHEYGAEILVDGAQWVPHMQVDMRPSDSPEHIDYLAFSAHKMYAPFGIGVLIGPKKVFEKKAPVYKGGGAVKLVTHKQVEWDAPPAKDEAGSPNIMGVVALAAAIKTLKAIKMDMVYRHEKALFDYAVGRLATVSGVRLYGCVQKEDPRIAVIPFNIDGIHHQLLAAMLSFEAGIAVRNGFFCSHPYSQRLLNLTEKDMELYFNNSKAPKPGLVRVSFGIYNLCFEIDRLVFALKTFSANRKYFLDKYESISQQCRFSNDV